MKYYITQHYTSDHKELYDLTSPIVKNYATNNGFIYTSNNDRRCLDRKVWWEKIAWLIEFLSTIEDGSLVVYEDCDSLNLGGDLKTALHNGMEFGMVQLRSGLGGSEIIDWYNAGVIIMINTADVRSFLKRVWDRNDETDETSINKELTSLKNSIGNGKPMCSLGVEWNCWYNNSHITNDLFIKSWHGIKYSDKLVYIKNFINSLK